MENQHRKIKGYRELTQEEVDLMNRIKEKGAELLALQGELAGMTHHAEQAIYNAIDNATNDDERALAHAEFIRFKNAEPMRWASIGKTDIQTGIMALVRSVAQPAGV